MAGLRGAPPVVEQVLQRPLHRHPWRPARCVPEARRIAEQQGGVGRAEPVGIGLDRHRDARAGDDAVEQFAVEFVAVTNEQVDVARGAWRRFGKGRHGAGLNFGDCFAYALATTSGEPLLFKGDDFSKTDVARVSLLVE